MCARIGNTVVVTLDAPNADLPYLMTDYQIPIMPGTDGRIDPASTDRLRRLHRRKLRAWRAVDREPQPRTTERGPRRGSTGWNWSRSSTRRRA